MNTNILKKIESNYQKNDFSAFTVGDSVKVHNIIRDGDKSRIQIFAGVVISKKGSGTRATFTVRKISDGIGVEKIFPVQSPNVEKIEIVKRGKARRSKLYYLQDRVGKSALKVRMGNENKAKAYTEQENSKEFVVANTTEVKEEVVKEIPAKEEKDSEVKNN